MARLSYGRRPDSISPAALLGSGWQPSGETKDLYDSAVQKLLDELGLSQRNLALLAFVRVYVPR